MSPTIGIVLMSFGTVSTPDEVPEFLKRVRGGAEPTPEVVAEMRRRYTLIGGSPLTGITLDQASALEALLNNRSSDGERFRVVVGMRHAPPFVAEAFDTLAKESVKRVIAVILSPQHSPILMNGYHQAVAEAKGVLGQDASVTVAGPWHRLPSFIDALAHRVSEALDRLPEGERHTAPVVMTAHSMPKSVVDQEPEYLDMLRETARSVARKAGLAEGRWQLAYQSAGHAPVEWLEPDIKDLFPGLQARGYQSVLVVPIQFLADHLELLYDIDVAAREQAEEAGLALSRTEAFNTMPAFIEALANVVRRELGAAVERG